jgi:hypothetical protein
MPTARSVLFRGIAPKWMLSFVTLLAPPDPGQLKEQALPFAQEYCHSNAISNPLGYEDTAGLPLS